MSNRNQDNEFEGQITVASRIVDYLSSGLYESPAACLKELINNSYDADATEVQIFIKPDADRIIIEDNGEGISKTEFEKHFKRISESFKRVDSDKTALGRPKIGKIGIGFIAANEICDVMEILSTKENSEELLEVSIRFDLMRQDISLRKKDNNDIAKADYQGRVLKTESKSHYTKIFLKKVRGEAKQILAGAGNSFSNGSLSLYGLNTNSIYNQLNKKTLKSWAEFDPYSKNIIEVSLNTPVRYFNNWIPKKLAAKVKEFESRNEKLRFNVIFDGSSIRKPILFHSNPRCFIEPFSFNGEFVSASGYFYAQHGAIKPHELQGMLVRIRNASIGGYDPSFWGYSPTSGPLFQTWISGEIYASNELEDAMNIDRKTLRVAHPAYVELQNAVHEFLDRLLKKVRDNIYVKQSNIRKIEQGNYQKSELVNYINESVKPISKSAATKSHQILESIDNEEFLRRLSKKYSFLEIFKILTQTLKTTLSEELFGKVISNFLKNLIK